MVLTSVDEMAPFTVAEVNAPVDGVVVPIGPGLAGLNAVPAVPTFVLWANAPEVKSARARRTRDKFFMSVRRY